MNFACPLKFLNMSAAELQRGDYVSVLWAKRDILNMGHKQLRHAGIGAD